MAVITRTYDVTIGAYVPGWHDWRAVISDVIAKAVLTPDNQRVGCGDQAYTAKEWRQALIAYYNAVHSGRLSFAAETVGRGLRTPGILAAWIIDRSRETGYEYRTHAEEALTGVARGLSVLLAPRSMTTTSE